MIVYMIIQSSDYMCIYIYIYTYMYIIYNIYIYICIDVIIWQKHVAVERLQFIYDYNVWKFFFPWRGQIFSRLWEL